MQHPADPTTKVRPGSGEPFTPTQFWTLNFLGWLAFALLGFLVRFVLHQDAGRALALTLAQEPVAFLFSGLLWLTYRRPGIGEPFHVHTATWMVGLCFFAALVQTCIGQLVTIVTGWTAPGWTEREQWFFRMIFVWMAYLIWSLAYFAVRARAMARTHSQQAAEARQAAQRMELRLLRAQLDPHFLFNSLNSIAAEITPHPDAAKRMVQELADYLRYSLDHRHLILAPLGTELDALGAYLRIEQARFGERLRVDIEADGPSRRRSVPSFLLQPLIENAVKFGLRSSAPPWEIGVRAGVSGNRLLLQVRNTGHFHNPGVKGSGVGIETLRRRLALHYPGRHVFELSQDEGFVTALLELEGEPVSG